MEQRSPISHDTSTPCAQAAIGVNLESTTPHATTVASVTPAAARSAPLLSRGNRRDDYLHTGPGRETHRRAAKTLSKATAITEPTLGALEEATA